MIIEKKLEINGLQVQYKIKESAQNDLTLIFIHGFPFDLTIWENQLKSLPENVQGIAYDIRGFGGSESGHSYFSIDLFAADLNDLIKILELKNVILCGVSMGGYIALRTLQRASENIVGLILCDTNASADTNEAKLKRFASIEQITQGAKKEFAEAFLKNIFSDKTAQTNQATIDHITNLVYNTNDSAICSAQLALASRTDSTSFLAQVEIPVLVMRGAEDVLMPREQAEMLHHQLKNSHIVNIDNAGHLPNVENPAAFNAEMMTFLSQFYKDLV
ncbi:hydrolase, alpha/beta fold family [Arcticibacter svalbardensis MN12-7]|uniref:Hydrolase, alpha/beta fold family n=1 Tax=Arcticibacter svalbardensis MN12-7 TaxID=1150600 RepID=R9GVW8_9SPHI|nr:alpha/beta hydrolase [Arcticibacter svalbardensis]EOR93074.1 hydrolase, alpha/beta fold family [Arcticibacter svalbardensis MN12-7]